MKLIKKNFSDDLLNIDGVASIFFGPGFVTITKEENIEWTSITQEILNIFDDIKMETFNDDLNQEGLYYPSFNRNDCNNLHLLIEFQLKTILR